MRQPTSRVRRAASLGLAAVMLAATACSASETHTKASPHPVPTRSLDASIPHEPVMKVQIARLEHRPGDWMVTGFGSLWVKQDNGSVDRLDGSGTLVAHVDTGLFQTPVCQGIGASRRAIWVCPRAGLIDRIDPHTNKIVARLKIPKVNEQGRLPFHDGRIWVLVGDGNRLVGISDRTNQTDASIHLPEYCTDVSDRVVGHILWVACASTGEVLRVDMATRKVTGRVRKLPLVSAVSADERHLWAGVEGGLAQIDVDSLSVRRVDEVAAAPYGSIRVSPHGVWAREGGTSDFLLARLSRTSGRVEQVVTVDSKVQSGGDVIEFAGALWTSSYEEDVVRKLRLP
jgi:hypothetical protein